MLAAVQGPDDRFSAVHRTWIDLDRPNGKAHLFATGFAVGHSTALLKKQATVALDVKSLL